MLCQTLAVREPLPWPMLFGFYAQRAVTGVEHASDDTYTRLLVTPNGPARLSLCRQGGALRLETSGEDAAGVVLRTRFALDCDCEIGAIERELLQRDPALAPLIAMRPGLRPPAGWDPFELAIRAVLGQQISVTAARGLAGKLVALADRRVPRALAGAGLTHVFPDPVALLATDLDGLPMPGAHRRALRAVAQAVLENPALLVPGGLLEERIEAWCAVPGVGPWTAQYIALRGLRHQDAFPAADAGLLRAARLLGFGQDARALARRAECWRPWRAYAAQHLWSADPG